MYRELYRSGLRHEESTRTTCVIFMVLGPPDLLEGTSVLAPEEARAFLTMFRLHATAAFLLFQT